DQLNIHELRSIIRRSFTHESSQQLLVSLLSFGFKYGLPPESCFVFDVRSMPNPYFVPELKMLNGTDQSVIDFLFQQESVLQYWQKLRGFVDYAIEKAHQE